jgi:large subunit ribosomal protein L11
MAKEISTTVKLQVEGGKANPAPPIGPVLGQHGVNIMEFCKQFNARTQKQPGEIVPVVITIYKDRSFTFELKTPPVSYLIKKTIKLEKGSAIPNKNKVGKITTAQVYDIARQKMQDLNCYDEDAAARIVMGTARSMGVDVVS